MSPRTGTVSPNNTPRGTAWWRCERCGTGEDRVRDTPTAIAKAAKHHAKKHPGYAFYTAQA